MTRNIFLKNGRKFTMLAAAVASLTLAACGQQDGTVGEHLDSAVAQVEQRTHQVVAATQATGQKLDQKLALAAAQNEQDATITASIKSQFAADPVLSPLKIDVQTQEGLVSLNGKAPDAASRDHATRVAVTVKDVLSVDNHMVLPKT